MHRADLSTPWALRVIDLAQCGLIMLCAFDEIIVLEISKKERVEV